MRGGPLSVQIRANAAADSGAERHAEDELRFCFGRCGSQRAAMRFGDFACDVQA